MCIHLDVINIRHLQLMMKTDEVVIQNGIAQENTHAKSKQKYKIKREEKRKSESGSQLLASSIAESNLNVLEKYKLVKILISSHPFNKIYLQAKNAVRCFSALLDKQFSMQLEQPSTD